MRARRRLVLALLDRLLGRGGERRDEVAGLRQRRPFADRAVPGQVMVGDFKVPMPDLETGSVTKIDTVEFIKKTQETLSSLKGLVLSGDEIESINCYLTGERTGDGAYSITKYLVTDKHGRTRNIYNAKINIYRKRADPIFLGVRAADLTELEVSGKTVVDS